MDPHLVTSTLAPEASKLPPVPDVTAIPQIQVSDDLQLEPLEDFMLETLPDRGELQGGGGLRCPPLPGRQRLATPAKQLAALEWLTQTGLWNQAETIWAAASWRPF